MRKLWISLLTTVLLLGGCFSTNEKTEEEKEGTTPVQDYVGQGFSFVDGDKSAERVKKYEEEIKQEAINYMKTIYKTDVKVNNVVPARNAAVVMVECEEPIQFHTSVIVSLVLNKDDVGSARSEEGEVEKAIVGGLYAKAYKEEFEHLDAFAEKLAKENDLLGMREEAIDKTASVGYAEKYYFIAIAASYYPNVYNAYIENPAIPVDELRNLFLKDDPSNEKMAIAMNFFSKEESLPKKELVDNLASEILQESRLPRGTYETTVYKNLIVNRVGLPDGESIDAKDIIK
ncbi:DUF1672 family protein [Listeria seeligeri]|uniref:DUF1672 family protein n=1 Tax=Listeria seeligeri TaxID=1640 RepID=UPI0016289DA5|nr:DUF1672 family protein [Listeria seeligeri]MBC1528560.1 DUF1672 family protein [Listeria seeligeri]MBC1941382.1 DUF1672 family protein [Listeria seeligeri]